MARSYQVRAQPTITMIQIDDSSTQRWKTHRPTWVRSSLGGFNPKNYRVDVITSHIAKEFVLTHHYSRSWLNDSQRYGLFDVSTDELVGAAVLSTPASNAVLERAFPSLEPSSQSFELGRFVLCDKVPSNAETWFLSRVRAIARERGVRGLVAFSDPVQRTTSDGNTIFPGHIGHIYQADNAIYTGQSRSQSMILLPDGTALSARTRSKILAGSNCKQTCDRLVEMGAPPYSSYDSLKDWLVFALIAIEARRVFHPGVHRYLMPLGTRDEKRRMTVGYERLETPPKAVVVAKSELFQASGAHSTPADIPVALTTQLAMSF